jgi:hypothetical protein
MVCNYCLRASETLASCCIAGFEYLASLGWPDSHAEYCDHLIRLADLRRKVRKTDSLRLFIARQRAEADRRFPLHGQDFYDRRDRFVVAQCKDLSLLGGSLSFHEMARDGVWTHLDTPYTTIHLKESA